MKLKPYIKKLNSSLEYKKFIESNKDAFLVAGFFVLDLEMGNNIHQIDFYVPSKKKFAAFTLDGKVDLKLIDTMSKKVPEKLDIKTNIDLDALKGILEDEMKNRSITEDIKKIIAIVQTIDGKKVWNINSVLSGMDLLKAHIEDESQTVLKMEKTSIMDIMKKIPTIDMQAMKQNQQVGKVQAGEEFKEDDAKEELEKLEKLTQEIEKEKTRIKKQIPK